MWSLSSVAASSMDGELDITDRFFAESIEPPVIKVPEKTVKTLNFKDIPHDHILYAIDSFFAEEEHKATVEKEQRL